MRQQQPPPSTRTGPAIRTDRGEPRRLLWLSSLALVAVAVAIALSRRGELAGAARLIERVSLPELAVAVAAEAASVLCLAATELWLLRAGGDRALRLPVVTAIVTAANAIAGVLPLGAAFAVAWVYRQYCRRGVPQVLAAAALVIAGALSAAALFVLLVLGVLVNGTSGLGATLAPALVVLTATLLAAAAATRSPGLRRTALRWWQRAGERWSRVRAVEESLVGLIGQARSVQPGVRPWLRPLGLSLLNWGFDAGCLACCLWALDIGIPWRGFLAVYGLTQVSTSLRLTPGSLGITEASLTGLLVLYGLPGDQALAAALLYRIVSYWAMQPIGWAAWLGITLRGRSRTD